MKVLLIFVACKWNVNYELHTKKDDRICIILYEIENSIKL